MARFGGPLSLLGSEVQWNGYVQQSILKEENAALKRELVRKEKALAEAAALLVLQKKFRALWEDQEQ